MQIWDCLLIISMKYVFGKKEISEGVWWEVFDEHINLNINLQIIALGVICVILLVYLTSKKLSKNYM